MKDAMLEEDRIEKKDFEAFRVVDTPEEVLSNIKNFYSKNK
jgi:predicted Rossmann-fold nucleotide-binding protein